ncbi:hypothetical protein ACQ4PT_068326 [Festuca glaucescens]
MEGLVPGNRVNQFRDQLKEGFVYTIVRFDLYDPKKNYRSVDHPLRIYFTMRIVLTEVVPPPENFPMFAYNALPFSMLSDRIDRNIVLSDILPPSGKAKSHKRQVYIIAGSEHAIVTLWGEQADLFDADGFMEASSEEHVIVLFVGMIVSQYSGLLAFKSTSVTRWHVNVPILEIAAVRERFVFRLVSARKRSIAFFYLVTCVPYTCSRSKQLPWRIELHNGNQNRAEPTVSSIIEISTFEPNDIMVCSIFRRGQ